ncbi:MAG: GTPase HflX [Chitinivibrionales bacterium]|nr:GTPase HflX [Chitinivibrionales bacterium]
MKGQLHATAAARFEKVILAGLCTADTDETLFELDMREMRMLCRTGRAQVLETVVQKRPKPDAGTYLGEGKLAAIAQRLKELGGSTLVIDAQLSPGQVRNIEKIVEAKVIDRSQLILDIFARHARTNEARIQVELAQLRTLYPRLTHAWSHFSQQVGGIGTTGPGEKQLEIDRRLIKKKITDLTERPERIDRQRQTQRASRRDEIKITLVGYTNVGKSSLLNALSGSDIYVADKLFATLDTATRRCFLPEVGSVVISDTVGFLRKLPHQLVASFKSTLQVVHEADLLLLVLDAASGANTEQYATVNEVLAELEAQDIPRLVLINKSDLLTDPFARKELQLAFPEGRFTSAFDAADMERLKRHIANAVTTVRAQRAEAAAQARQDKNPD